LPTVFDKDIVIYCISKLMQAKNQGEAIKQEVRLTTHDLLVETNRPTNNLGYERLLPALIHVTQRTSKIRGLARQEAIGTATNNDTVDPAALNEPLTALGSHCELVERSKDRLRHEIVQWVVFRQEAFISHETVSYANSDECPSHAAGCRVVGDLDQADALLEVPCQSRPQVGGRRASFRGISSLHANIGERPLCGPGATTIIAFIDCERRGL
jgi:hypothetical protein